MFEVDRRCVGLVSVLLTLNIFHSIIYCFSEQVFVCWVLSFHISIIFRLLFSVSSIYRKNFREVKCTPLSWGFRFILVAQFLISLYVLDVIFPMVLIITLDDFYLYTLHTYTKHFFIYIPEVP